MNITKQQWIIVVALGVIAVWYFFLRKKDTKESGSGLESAYSKKKPKGYIPAPWEIPVPL